MSISPITPERSDVLFNGIAPKHIRKFLRDVGGVTPWGENRYRLVVAECVMLHIGARWHDWAPGTGLTDQGGLDMFLPVKEILANQQITDKTPAAIAEMVKTARIKPNTPERVVEEMRWIPRYTDIKGWLLQAWFPSSYYSPEHYEITVTGRPDLPLLGEFPAKGQYERQFFHLEQGPDGQWKPSETFKTIPGHSWMETAIAHNEMTITKRGAGTDPNSTEVQWRTLNAVQELMKARASYEKAQRDKFEDEIRDSIAPIFSNSLEGGRIREELAKSARAKGVVIGHVGN